MARTPRRAPPVASAPATTPTLGSVTERHPDLELVWDDWREVRDARAGATAVKKEGERYLPMPSGFRGQADSGVAMYEAYRKRAQFPEIFGPTVEGMLGILHRREAQIEGLEGSGLEALHERATPTGLTLEALHLRISDELLSTGRVAVLADAPSAGGDTPTLALYTAESLINWSEAGDFFVLEEKSRERDGYSWTDRTRYRVLQRTADGYEVRVVDHDGTTPTAQSEGEQTMMPQARGGARLTEIPLVVAGARGLSVDIDTIPLMGVVRSSTALYRLDADYRHQLFMSGQETLFVYGAEAKKAPAYVGAGVVHVFESKDAKAEYVGPRGIGIEAHRKAIEDEREAAATAGARIFDTQKRGAESGDALRIRSRASTATLVSIALASAAVLERALRHAAVFAGLADPSKIVVKPNLDFVDAKLTPDEAKKLVEVWQSSVISYQTLYENLQRGEIASQERTAEEELELRAEEDAALRDEIAALGGDDPESDPSADPSDPPSEDE